MSRRLAADLVEAAAAAWAWYPGDATVVDRDGLLLVRWPAYFQAPPALLRHAGDACPAGVLDLVTGHVRGWGFDEVLVWVGLGASPDLETALLERGGVLKETLDVLALDLSHRPDLGVPHDLTVRWQCDEVTTRAAVQVAIAAFAEGSMPDDARVRELAAEAAADLDAGRGATALAYLGDRPIASGGLTLADGVARLWGGGVVPDARGRGAYRAVLDARLDHAAGLGAGLALVKGRVETSGPILRRAGFEVFGQECSYVVPVNPDRGAASTAS